MGMHPSVRTAYFNAIPHGVGGCTPKIELEPLLMLGDGHCGVGTPLFFRLKPWHGRHFALLILTCVQL